MQEQKQTLTQEASVIYACRAIVGRDTPAILIVKGIPGGWSFVWNERFTIVWFSPSVRGSHVFGGLAWATDRTKNQWLVNSLRWLAFQWYTESTRENGWRGWYIPWGRAFLSLASMVKPDTRDYRTIVHQVQQRTTWTKALLMNRDVPTCGRTSRGSWKQHIVSQKNT